MLRCRGTEDDRGGVRSVGQLGRTGRDGAGRGAASLAPSAAPAILAHRPVCRCATRCVRRNRCPGIQPGTGQTPQGARPEDGAVRESSGLGVAAGAGAHDWPLVRPGAVSVAVRDRFLRQVRGARGIRGASSGRPDPARRRPGRGTRGARHPRGCAPRGAAAGKSRGRGRTPRRRLRRRRRVDFRSAPRHRFACARSSSVRSPGLPAVRASP